MKWCECCQQRTHFIDECQRIHFKKDYYKASLVTKSGMNSSRDSSFTRNKNRPKYNFFLYNDEVTNSIDYFRTENQDIFEIYDQIIEEDEDYFYHRRKTIMNETQESLIIRNNDPFFQKSSSKSINEQEKTSHGRKKAAKHSFNQMESIGAANQSEISDGSRPILPESQHNSSQKPALNHQSSIQSDPERSSLHAILRQSIEIDKISQVQPSDSPNHQPVNFVKPITFKYVQDEQIEQIEEVEEDALMSPNIKRPSSTQIDANAKIQRKTQRRQSQLPQHFKSILHVPIALKIAKQASRTSEERLLQQEKARKDSDPKNQLLQAQEIISLIKNELLQFRQNYDQRPNTIATFENYQTESCQEFEVYLPWNNIGNVLIKKNFKKLQQIKGLRNKRHTNSHQFNHSSYKNSDIPMRKSKPSQDNRQPEDSLAPLNEIKEINDDDLSSNAIPRSLHFQPDGSLLEPEGKLGVVNESQNQLVHNRVIHNSQY